MVNRDEYNNKSGIYKDNTGVQSEPKSDEYDYMDSLMEDIMGTEEVSRVDLESEPEDIVDEVSLEVEDIKEEEVEKEVQVVKKKRMSLFQKIGVKVKDDEDASYIESKELTNDFGDEVKSDSSTGVKVAEDSLYTEDVLDEEVADDSPYISVKDSSYVSDEVSVDSSYTDNEVSIDDFPIEKIDENFAEIQVENELRNSVETLEKEDSFEGMLNDLSVDFEEDLVNKEEKKVKIEGVEVPLETPEMREVKVTSDGRTLAEMLPGLRSGRKTVNQIVKEIQNQDSIIEIDGKKFSDSRYTEHIKVIEKERKEQEKRKSLSKKFIQRNSKLTEQEKIIMANLGVSSEGFAKLMGSKELTKKEKEKIIGLGRYGAEKYFKGRKYRTTVGDTAMLEFLVKFKFANTRILRWISNEPQGRTWRKLNRLRDNGLVESQTLIGVPDLWAATPAGVAVSGYTYDPGLRPMPKMTTISSSMGVNYIAACLWFNTVNVLNLPDFPAENRMISLQEDGREKVRGEMLVSELEIRSSLGKEITPSSTTMRTLGDEKLYDIISANVRNEISRWERNGKVGDSPEFSLGNEYMWILFPAGQLTLSYHVPDLVIKRERGPNGEPKSIAVEMERYEKTNDKYDKIMLAFKLDEHLYEKVIWITPNARIARALEQAAKNVGFTRYSIVPIITETGVYDKQDIWMI